MKKFLVFSAMLGAMAFAVPSVEAKTASTTAAAGEQLTLTSYTQPRRNRWNRRVRTVTTTRVTRVGRYRYRETIRTTYLPNGRTRTQVINRVRVGRW
jgi:hypothetical protein